MDTREATRRSLHGIAEVVLAGPQYRTAGRIRLRVTPGGFGTTLEPDLRLDGDQLVAGPRRITLDGATYAGIAREAGVDAGAPEGLYKDGSGVELDEKIVLDAEALRAALSAFATGEEALRRFAPAELPVLWPEHFDLAITVDEINYGVSTGDGYSPEPYAYVGPHRPRQGPFWTAPFGAARALRELADVAAFFEEGREAAGRS